MKIPSQIIQSIVERISPEPRFMFGNWVEISNNLSLLDNDKDNDGTKYPLIVMNNDFEEKQGEEIGVYSQFEANFYLITEANADDDSTTRLSTTYTDVLYPLKDKFIKVLFQSPLLVWDLEFLPNEKVLPCTIKNLYYLSNENKQQNKLNDIVDAMSIKINLKIRR